MSELKATTAQEIVRNEKDCDYMDELFGGVKMPPTQVYLKYEADKVITELKKACNDKDDWCLHILKENRHQKFKRCLAMADKCQEALCYWDNVKYTYFKGEAYCFRKLNHYGRWGQIWLAIAEKFKEVK